jgi:pimeloyl-ACP methyl ester carboxylesterase
MTPVLKGFVTVPHGQVHFRYGGRGPVVVMLHDCPRSSMVHASNIEWLGEHFTVIALDTPGCGNSTPLPQDVPGIKDFADALADTLGALGIERCALYGFHAGANIALQFAVDHPGRAPLAILDGLALPAAPATPENLERYLQAFEPTADGAYLVRQWSRILDFHRYSPWFAPAAATRMRLPLPDDASLHACATDLLMAGPHWVDACRAALSYAAAPAIASLRSRTVFMCREDDVSFGYLDALPPRLPAHCSVERIAPTSAQWRTRLLEILKAGTLPAAAWSPPQQPRIQGGAVEQQRYANLIHGQLCVRVRGASGATPPPLLLLHDVPGAASSLQPFASLLATDRLTILPDLPGLGESHPLPYPTLGSYVMALSELLEQLGTPTVDVLAEGLGTCFAIALAAHRPSQVRRVFLDGVPMIRSRERRFVARDYCPPIVPDRHGTHLLRIWHQLRDSEMSWPWFDRSADAARIRDPQLDAHQLHAALVDVMKHLPSYGDASRAALEASVRDILRGVHQPVLLLDVPDDVRYSGTTRAARRLTSAQVLPRAPALADRIACARQFLA